MLIVNPTDSAVEQQVADTVVQTQTVEILETQVETAVEAVVEQEVVVVRRRGRPPLATKALVVEEPLTQGQRKSTRIKALKK